MIRRKCPRMFAAANRMNEIDMAYGAIARAAGKGAKTRVRSSATA